MTTHTKGMLAAREIIGIVDAQDAFITRLVRADESSTLTAALELWRKGVQIEVSGYQHTRSYSSYTTRLSIPSEIEIFEEIPEWHEEMNSYALLCKHVESREIWYIAEQMSPEEEAQMVGILALQLGFAADSSQEWLYQVLSDLEEIGTYADWNWEKWKVD